MHEWRFIQFCNYLQGPRKHSCCNYTMWDHNWITLLKSSLYYRTLIKSLPWITSLYKCSYKIAPISEIALESWLNKTRPILIFRRLKHIWRNIKIWCILVWVSLLKKELTGHERFIKDLEVQQWIKTAQSTNVIPMWSHFLKQDIWRNQKSYCVI